MPDKQAVVDISVGVIGGVAMSMLGVPPSELVDETQIPCAEHV
jgi:hypothetical protein